jgi:endoglucanase
VRDSARSFLEHYVGADGRVVRRDQGGDTVSEGQAYAMLLAVAAGDRARFDRVWDWTLHNLGRSDGLFSWHWAGGRVVDQEPSSDADLDIAHALVLAGRRWGRPALAAKGRRIGAVILREETAGGVLVAGPWARDAGVVNPSYLAPSALRGLGSEGGRVADRTRDVVAALGPTPPDWARLGPPPRPAGPGGDPARPPGAGFDAARVPIRLATSCDRGDRALAARLAPPRGDHPVFDVAAAARAAARGDRGRAAELLDDAQSREDDAPTYYGSAWVALGRALLQGGALGRCGRGA